MGGTVRSLAFQHDANGNRRETSANSGYWATFGHDGLNRLTGVFEGGANPVTRIAYDAQGRRKRLEQGLGTVSSTTAYSYDAAGRLQSLARDLPGTGADETVTLTYNPAGQIVSRTGSDAYGAAV